MQMLVHIKMLFKTMDSFSSTMAHATSGACTTPSTTSLRWCLTRCMIELSWTPIQVHKWFQNYRWNDYSSKHFLQAPNFFLVPKIKRTCLRYRIVANNKSKNCNKQKSQRSRESDKRKATKTKENNKGRPLRQERVTEKSHGDKRE